MDASCPPAAAPACVAAAEASGEKMSLSPSSKLFSNCWSSCFNLQAGGLQRVPSLFSVSECLSTYLNV